MMFDTGFENLHLKKLFRNIKPQVAKLYNAEFLTHGIYMRC